MGVEIDGAPTLEPLIAQAQKAIRYVGRVRFQVAAAGDYGALDVMSGNASADEGRAFYIPNLVQTPGGVFTFTDIHLRCSEDATLNQIRMHFFDVLPEVGEVEMDDNAAFDIKTEAGREKWVGMVTLNALADFGAGASLSSTTNINVSVKCAKNDNGIWVVLQTVGAEVNESAGMVLEFDIYGV